MSLIRKLTTPIKGKLLRALESRGYSHFSKYTRPYIIKKHVEGVDLLFLIADQHSKTWYDVYSGDGQWREMAFIRDNLIIPGTTVIECGSHHGMTAILMANWLGPSGRVLALEPSPFSHGVLYENIHLNHLDNISPLQVAAGEERSIITFSEIPDGSMGSHVSNLASANAIDVELIPLDDYIKVNPSLVKIDVQGYVHQVLQGMAGLLEQCRPNLAIEVDSPQCTSSMGGVFDDIFKLLDLEGYTYYVSFDASCKPEPISIRDVVSTWERINECSGDIHLFGKSRFYKPDLF